MRSVYTERKISLIQKQQSLRADTCCFKSLFILIIINKIGSTTEKSLKTFVNVSFLYAIVGLKKVLK